MLHERFQCGPLDIDLEGHQEVWDSLDRNLHAIFLQAVDVQLDRLARHAALLAHGITVYTWDALWDDDRLYVLRQL